MILRPGTWGELKVGQAMRTVRRTFTGRVVHEAEVVVTRVGKTIDATYPGGGPSQRYRQKDGEWVLTPAYLDYTETLEPPA